MVGLVLVPREAGAWEVHAKLGAGAKGLCAGFAKASQPKYTASCWNVTVTRVSLTVVRS